MTRKHPAFALFLLVMLCAGQAAAQALFTVKGVVQDTAGTRIDGASVRIISGKDTVRSATDADGAYHINLKPGTFTLMVNYLGYFPFQGAYTPDAGQSEMEIPPVVLRPASRLLTEVKIEAPVQAVTYKRDTIEYDPRAFSVTDRDKVIDLLRQFPGLEVDENGNIKSDGENITFLRVNGKNFFSGNVTDFIRQLPADMFAKLQVIDDYGDEAAFTGIRNGQPRKMLNLVTKPGMDRGTFGNGSLTGGTDDRYGASVNGNYWRTDRQIAASSGYNTANNSVGTNTSGNIGVNYADNWGKNLNIQANYNFGNGRNASSNDTYIETVNTLGTIFNRSGNNSESKNNNHSANLGLNYRGKKTMLSLSPSFNFSDNTANFLTRSAQSGVIHQDLESINANQNDNRGFGLGMTVGHKIGKKGRVFSLNFSINANRGAGDQDVNDNIRYYNEQGLPAKDSILHRVIDNNNRSLSGGMNFSFSQPINKKMSVDFSYGFNGNKNKNDLNTGVIAGLKPLQKVDSLSNFSNTSNISHRINLSYRIGGKKFNATAGIRLSPGVVNGEYSNRPGKVKNTSNNFSPSINMSYLASTATTFSADYSGSSQAPSVYQLQPVRDTRSLQNVIVGNPDLKVAFSHRGGVNYRHTNIKKGNTFSISLNGGTTQNQIVSNTILRKDTLNSLKQETRYENVNGAYNVGSNYSLSIPYKIAGKKYSIGLTGNLSYAKQISLSDNVKNFSKGLNIGQSLSTNVFTKTFSGGVSARYSNNMNTYTLGTRPETRITGWQFSSNVNLRVKKFNVSSNASKSITSGYRGVQNNNPLMINASASRSFLKNDMGSFNVQVNDILNQGSNLSRIISGNSIIENNSKYITRYVVVGLNMQLNRFGGRR
ncbi:TonB-dependent receptor [Hufsiella ginkgonis]|uniref:Outer membrane beta-barrel protein n=1 Tax=Hufsiella ginkgonis TaxID=2695274 RepID=A0A7K1XV49_9SPHI|nr:TonB-dependent receptor [Hufsiella ginkgonis]MXV14885.1 outer membrane beta-barrel protein [Hufsiella ginkgonis]